MKWDHIKTLFILSFLILNIYLVTALIDRQQDVGYLDNKEQPIEDQLTAENITYNNIDVDTTEAAYLSVTQKNFSAEELEAINNLENQTAEVINNSFIVARLEEPVKIEEQATYAEIQRTVQPNVLDGEEYILWSWNEDINVLLFFQTKEDLTRERTIYYNENGLLLVYLNENNEITHYTQTVLGQSEVQGELVTLNQPVQVIGSLYKGNYLNRGDEVTGMNLGFYSRIAAEGIQVFAPTWRVTINNERSHLVNAIEGIVYESKEEDFLRTVIEENIARIITLGEDNEVQTSILPELAKRLDIDNRSETE